MPRPASTHPVTPLRLARLKARLSIEAAARAAEVSPVTWRRVEAGLQRPKRPGAFAAAVGISVEEVLRSSRF